jgi:hypothetical protein
MHRSSIWTVSLAAALSLTPSDRFVGPIKRELSRRLLV